MLPRCGRAAHICEANYFATSSPCCNCTFLKLSNSQLIIFMKQVANSDKATGQLLHAGRQKQQPTWKNSLFSRIVSCETLLLGEQLALHFRRCPALLSLRDISPHYGESPSSAELSQLDRFWLQLHCLQFFFQIVQFPLRFQSAQPNISLSRCHRERLYPPNVIVEYPCFRVNRNI